MPDPVDFSANANVYDRRHGRHLSPELTARLVDAADLSPGARLLDLAAGTGRAALPFAWAGLDVTAGDIAAGMLRTLRAKAGRTEIAVVTLTPGPLPFETAYFDAVSIARALYLVPDWRDWLAEMVRVMRPGGVLLHEWANGTGTEPWARLRDDLRERLDRAGYPKAFHPGARCESDVEAHLARLDLTPIARIASDAGLTLTLAEFADRIARRETSYLWAVPDAVGEAAMAETRAWAAARFDVDAPFDLHGGSAWALYSKPGRKPDRNPN